MLTIRTQGNRAQIIGNVPDALSKDLEARFQWQSLVDMNDFISFYNPEGHIIYSGIIHDVKGFIEDRGIPCEIEFQAPSSERYNWEMKRPPRPLHLDAVNALIHARYGILRSPPGTGKTDMSARAFCTVGLPGSFMVVPNNRPGLQAYRTLCDWTTIEDVGLWNGTTKKLAKNGVTVITIQSLYAQLINNPDGEVIRAWKKAPMVIVDEAHHGASDTHLKVFELLHSVRYFFGMSATPWRDDDRHDVLDMLLGSIVHEITRAQAIDNKLSVPITVFVEDITPKEYGFVVKETYLDPLTKEERVRFVNKAQHQRYKKGPSPLDQVTQDYIVNNVERNTRALDFCRQAIQEGLSCCISVRRLNHIKNLQLLEPRVMSLHANTKDRDVIFDEMVAKKHMLVASTLMDEAVDVSSLSCVAMLAGGASTVKLEQRIRCDRTFNGMTVHGHFAKDRGYVWIPRDHADFLTSQSTKCLKILKSICDEHEEHEFILNGNLIKRGRQVPKYIR